MKQFFQALGPFSRSVRFGIHVQANGIWDQLARLDGGPIENGWTGAYRATGPGQMTVLGYGCTIRYEIQTSAGVVQVRVVDERGPSYKGICGPQDLVAQTAIYDTASFFRQP